tara:strand:+ start:1102 stop:1467 length:366 start_codon:yes stop_codon:yes gene_type:complete
MKFKITEQKKNNTVTLNVRMTKGEIKSSATVNYGWRSAKEKLEQEGYNLGKMLEYTTLMNKFSVYEGDFIFTLKTPVEKPKTDSKIKIDKTKNVPTLKEEVKSSSQSTTKVTTGRSSRKKK